MRDPRLRPFGVVLPLFGIMLGLLMISGAVLFARKLGLSPADVKSFYLGAEEAFTRPRTLPGLLEVAVPHLLAVPLVLLVAVHLVAFFAIVPRPMAAKLTRASFAIAAASIGAGFGVRYLSADLAWFKIGAFVAFEGMLGCWLVLWMRLLRPMPDQGSVTTDCKDGAANA